MTRRLFALSAILLVTACLGFAFAQTPAAATVSEPMKIGGDVLPPVLVHSAEPKFARGAGHKISDDIVLVGLTVDKAGKSTNIHIIKSSDPNFDKVSIKAVSKYRFRPATFHGEPVAVELQVQIKFSSY